MNKKESSESEDDWFEQDEEELLNKLSKKLQQEEESKIENISLPYNSTDLYMRTHRINAGAGATATNANTVKRLSIDELRKLSKGTPLNAFLFAFTSSPINFFVSQILPNDSVERVQLYTRILASICSLNLPGFHLELILHFVENHELLENLQFLSTKFLTKHEVEESKEYRQMLLDMEILFLEAFRENLLTVKCKNVLEHVSKLIKNEDIWQKLKQFDVLFKNDTYSKQKCQVYPSLEELMQPLKPLDSKPNAGNTIETYIERQQMILKYDFLSSLHCAVQTLRSESKWPANWLLVEPVTIQFNEDLTTAERNQRVFVNLFKKKKNKNNLIEKLKLLKIGTLLCFTTNRNFDNLIYATYNWTSIELLKFGFLSIEILRQYNIGNICKQDFIMFEAPNFFEPYNHVYNCVSRFKLKNELPFSKYLIQNQLNLKLENLKSPAYISEKEEFEAADLSNLNASQIRAYKSALKQEMCLIQGPPGTGKTHMSVKLIRTLMENTTNTPVVLITYTNDSLDKFLLLLSQHTQNFIRFGRSREPKIESLTSQEPSLTQIEKFPILKKLYFLTRKQLNQRTNELKNLQVIFDNSEEEYQKILTAQQNVNYVEQKMNTLKIIFQYHLASGKQLIGMTTSFAAKTHLIFNLLQSKIVIFEEAAEILECHAIACLSAHTQHVIMVGDHLQLQPFTLNHALRRAFCVNVSLFERLMQEGLPYTQLATQYRMRPDIAKLLTPLFYRELNNAECVEKHETVRGMHANLYFCKHTEAEVASTDGGGSYCNEYEARKVVKLIEYLYIKQKYKADDIAILTPYSMQVQVISEHLANRHLRRFPERVSTVDSFQGLEANIVVLSLVRSNNKKSVGFLSDKHRICVALSRARFGLYIIGNIELFASNSNHWKKIKKILEGKSAIGNQFPYQKT